MEEFRSIGPLHFFALIDRLKATDRPRNATIELMTAQLIAMVGNTGFRGFKEPCHPRDFMPSMYDEQKKAKPRKATKQQKRAAAERLRTQMGALMGR